MTRPRTNYAEARPIEGGFGWRVYHYDDTGNREVRVAASPFGDLWPTAEAALEACILWMDDNDVFAEVIEPHHGRTSDSAKQEE